MALSRRLTVDSIFSLLERQLGGWAALEAFQAALLAILHDESTAVLSATALLADTTRRMLRFLAASPVHVAAFLPPLLSELSELAASPGVQSVTAQDREIWQTPAFVEWKAAEETSGFVPATATAARKTRGKKGSNPFGQNDAQWARELEEELHKDKIAKEKAEKAIASRLEVLQRQAEVRAAVQAVAQPYQTVLGTLGALLGAPGNCLEPFVAQCVALLLPLLSNPLVKTQARESGRGAE